MLMWVRCPELLHFLIEQTRWPTTKPTGFSMWLSPSHPHKQNHLSLSLSLCLPRKKKSSSFLRVLLSLLISVVRRQRKSRRGEERRGELWNGWRNCYNKSIQRPNSLPRQEDLTMDHLCPSPHSSLSPLLLSSPTPSVLHRSAPQYHPYNHLLLLLFSFSSSYSVLFFWRYVNKFCFLYFG